MFNQAIDKRRAELESLLFGTQKDLSATWSNPIDVHSHQLPPARIPLPPDGRFYSAHLKEVQSQIASNPLLMGAYNPPSWQNLANQRSVDNIIDHLAKVCAPQTPFLVDSDAVRVEAGMWRVGGKRRAVKHIFSINIPDRHKIDDMASSATQGSLQNLVIPQAPQMPQGSESHISQNSPANSKLKTTEPHVPPSDPKSWSAWFSSLVKKTAAAALPASWYLEQGGLKPPMDLEIKANIASIYGGDCDKMRFVITLSKATDVPGMDWLLGTSDPYCEVLLVRGVAGISAGQLDALPTLCPRKTSSVIYTTNSPIWNEAIELDAVDVVEVIADCVLHVSLWDWDSVGSNDPIGYTTMPLIDSLEVSGLAPFPLCPIQGQQPLSSHAGIFVKFDMRMQDNVVCLVTHLIALQGMEPLVGDSNIRVEVKVVKGDPLASSSYLTQGVCEPEISSRFSVQESGHVNMLAHKPMTLLFRGDEKAQKKKPERLYVHLTVTGDGAFARRLKHGQVAISLAAIEELKGFKGLKLKPLQGNPDSDGALSKCRLFFAVKAELAKE